MTGEIPMYLERNLSKRYFVHHVCHMDWPGIEVQFSKAIDRQITA